MGDILTLLVLALPLIGIWTLVVRPTQRRAREAALVAAQLEPGQDVVTTSGLFGTVAALTQDSVTLTVAPGVSLRFARQAIAGVVSDASTDDDTQAVE